MAFTTIFAPWPFEGDSYQLSQRIAFLPEYASGGSFEFEGEFLNEGVCDAF